MVWYAFRGTDATLLIVRKHDKQLDLLEGPGHPVSTGCTKSVNLGLHYIS